MNSFAVFRNIMLSLPVVIGCNTAYAEEMPFFYGNKKIDTRTWYVSNGWSNGDYHACEWREDALSENNKKLRITISDKGGKVRPLACGEIKTKTLYSYGKYEARIKAAKGVGVNTAFFTYAGYPNKDVHDEIDFEFLGKDTRKVQVNSWVDGKQTPKLIDLGFDASQDFHDYSFIWSPSKIKWYIDGKLVHETKDGAEIPSHPQNLFFSLWSSTKAMKDWMGEFVYAEPIAAEFSEIKYTPYSEVIKKNNKNK